MATDRTTIGLLPPASTADATDVMILETASGTKKVTVAGVVAAATAGLGTAATSPASAFATAAQGTTADAAIPNTAPALATLAQDTAFSSRYTSATTAILATTGDQTAALQALINTAMGAGGNGWLFIPVNGTIRIDGQITFPNDGGATPKQRPLRITGIGASHSGQGSPPTSGTILDMRYAGGTKMVTYGLGRLVLEHLTLTDTTDGTQNFLQTTNTTLWINDVEVYGKTGITPAQDAFVLGGTSLTLDGSANAAFQGYGTVIQNSYFNRVRRGVYGRTYCNGVVVRDNTWWTQCGADSSAAPIEFVGLAGNTCSGNVVVGNVIEMVNYVYGIKAEYAIHNTFGPNGFFDTTGATLGCVYLDANAQYNLVIDGFRNDARALLVENGVAAGTNTTLTSHQSMTSVFSQFVKFTRAVEVAGLLTFTGGSANRPFFQPAAAQADASGVMEARRSAAEGTNPGTTIFNLQQHGLLTIGGAQAGNINFNDGAGVSLATISTNGKTWTAAGAGGNMQINSGTGGSYLTLRNFGVKLVDHTGANTMTLKNSTASPEGAQAQPVGSVFFRTDGGPGTTLYVKESGAATNAGWVAHSPAFQRQVVSKAISYAVTAFDDVVIFTATTLTCTLPTAVGITGRLYTIKNTFAGNLTIATTSAQTIDGAAPGVLAQWGIGRYMSDGSNWLTI